MLHCPINYGDCWDCEHYDHSDGRCKKLEDVEHNTTPNTPELRNKKDSTLKRKNSLLQQEILLKIPTSTILKN